MSDTVPLHPALHPAPRIPRLFLCTWTTEPHAEAVRAGPRTDVIVHTGYAMAHTELEAGAVLRDALLHRLPAEPADRYRAGAVREALITTAAYLDEAMGRDTSTRYAFADGDTMRTQAMPTAEWEAFKRVGLEPQTHDGATTPARFRAFEPDCLPARLLSPRYCYQLQGKRCAIDPVREYGYWERADGAEGGGLWFDRKPDGALELSDYDGAFNLPAKVTAELRAWGVVVGPEFDVDIPID